MHYGTDDTDRLRQSASWSAHVKGQTAILCARKPQEFRSGKAHQLFVDLRHILVSYQVFEKTRSHNLHHHQVIAALQQRKRSILNSKGWKTAPWKSIRKSPQDKLLDILGDIAGLFEDIDDMKLDGEPEMKAAARHKITANCLNLDQRLQSWRNDLGCLKDFQNPNVDDDLGPRDSEDFALAHVTILYWATCILLYSTSTAFVTTGSQVPSRMKLPGYVRSLASALPFFFTPSAGIMGPKLAAFPLGIMLRTLYAMEFGSSERQSILKSVCELQDKDGGDIWKFLVSLR